MSKAKPTTSSAVEKSHSNAMSKSPATTAPPLPANEALAKIRKEVDALVPEQVLSPKVKPDAFALVAAGVAQALGIPELVARFKRIPEVEFDPKYIDLVRFAAWALEADALMAPAAGTNKVAPEVIVPATERRDRMLKLQRYHLESDDIYGPRLDGLPSGKSFDALASDLLKLSSIQTAKRDALKDDKINFRPNDATLAHDEALEIQRQIKTDKSDAAKELTARVYTVLINSYQGHVQPLAQFLFRAEQETLKHFPASLVGDSRSAPANHESPPTPAPTTPPTNGGAPTT
jgi:hypothetical protein